MSSARIFLFPSPVGSDGHGSRAKPGKPDRPSDDRRSATIVPELSRGALRLTMVKTDSIFDRGGVDEGNPFYPAREPIGVFLEALTVGVLLAGIAAGSAILLGLL